jgi:hypothetical protein
VVGLSLTKAPTQPYSGLGVAGDPFPNICLNAQAEFKSVRYVATVPTGETAGLILTGGISVSKVSGITNGEVITITGNTKGSYSVKMYLVNSSTHAEVNGKVFEFALDHNGLQYVTGGTTGTGAHDMNNFAVKIFDHTANLTTGSAMNGEIDISVVTSPSASFSGQVKIGAKINYEYLLTMIYVNGRWENGSPFPLAFNFGPVSFNPGWSGSNNVIAKRASIRNYNGNQEDVYVSDLGDVNSTGTRVWWPHVFFPGGINQQVTTSSYPINNKILSLGGSPIKVVNNLAIAGKTTLQWNGNYIGCSITAGNPDQSASASMKLKNITDNSFQIQ